MYGHLEFVRIKSMKNWMKIQKAQGTRRSRFHMTWTKTRALKRSKGSWIYKNWGLGSDTWDDFKLDLACHLLSRIKESIIKSLFKVIFLFCAFQLMPGTWMFSLQNVPKDYLMPRAILMTSIFLRPLIRQLRTWSCCRASCCLCYLLRAKNWQRSVTSHDGGRMVFWVCPKLWDSHYLKVKSCVHVWHGYSY